jgi:cellulose biosynthesis protein BcsQ
MAMIAMVSAKAAPGVTTSVALLATCWPGSVVAADLDPAGGDLTAGWLGGQPYPERSMLSFAIDAEGANEWAPAMLHSHLQPVAGAPHCSVLAGLPDPARIQFVRGSAWHRLAHALAGISRPQPDGVDVIVDCGRFGPDTPLSVLSAADLVLVALRPQQRHVASAQHLVGRLGQMIGSDRLGLAVCATSPFRTIDAEQRIGVPAVVALPHDARCARVFSDGGRRPVGFRRSRLIRAATHTAQRLHDVLNHDQSSAVAA